MFSFIITVAYVIIEIAISVLVIIFKLTIKYSDMEWLLEDELKNLWKKV